MDFIIVLIVVLSAILGARKGFAMTLASFMQWFICIIAGLLLCNKTKVWLMDHTVLDDTVNQIVLSHIETTMEESAPYKAMPDLFSSWINQGVENFAYGTSSSITNVVMTVIGFLIVVFAIKIIGFLVVHLFSRKYTGGVIGFFDGLMGFLFGLVRGVLLVLVFFSVLVPVLGTIWPDLSETIVGLMDGTRLAELIYNDNMILVLIRDLFS